MLEHRGISMVLIQWNPFFALLEIVRGPLLGMQLEPGTWFVALGYSALLILLAGFVFARARSRIAYLGRQTVAIDIDQVSVSFSALSW